ncbi:MAG: DUF364 domain-containing protein [Rubrivivax sp.]|nr:DUF364 domain-containing protein [Rubrivivax sp.]
MAIADELLQHLAESLAGRPVPAVRDLHLPREATRGRKDGEFCLLELDDGSLGLSFVLLGDALPRLRALAPAGQDPLALAQGWLGDEPAGAALGLAAVNALSRHLFDRAGFVPPAATESLAGLAPRAGDHLGMVGLFPPLIAPALAQGARLTVLELRADLAGPREGYRVTLDPEDLATCNKLLITSSALLNRSLDGLLAQAPQAQEVALVGPGAGCVPDVLFRHGVTALAGTWITDGPALCRAVREGVPWAACTRKFLLRRAIPGRP